MDRGCTYVAAGAAPRAADSIHLTPPGVRPVNRMGGSPGAAGAANAVPGPAGFVSPLTGPETKRPVAPGRFGPPGAGPGCLAPLADGTPVSAETAGPAGGVA